MFGVAACYYISAGSLRGAVGMVALAMLMDLLDGMLAGKLNQQSRFGAYLDSFVDFFVCCIIPVMLVYSFVGASLPLYLAMAFYCMCGMWRLAYYQIVTATEGQTFFTGMPVPGGALLVSMSIWIVVHYYVSEWLSVAVFALTGLLMISYFRLEKYGLWQKAMWLLGIAFFGLVMAS